MKIPLVYPKIPEPKNCPLKQCIAFEKLDGTNISFYWNREYKAFGTRRDRFDLSNDGVKEFNSEHPGIDVHPFEFDPGGYIEKVLEDHFLHSDVVIFTEFFGPNSFAGQHDRADNKQLAIIDVKIDDQILPPKDFIELFKTFNIPKVVYKGKYTGQFVEDVRNGKYNVNEGVVVKGVVDGEVYMTKIKTNAYMEKLKSEFKDNWKDYWE